MEPNRHPIDQLADIREQRKTLDESERVLKNEIMASLKEEPTPGDPQVMLGDEHVASISVVVTERLDRAEVEAALSGPKFQKCLKSSRSVTIRTTPRAQSQAA